jgi:hypothetical protein
MDVHTKDSPKKKSPIYQFPLLITGIIYKNVEIFFKKEKKFFKEQNVGKEKWRIFLGIFLLCFFFPFCFSLPPTWNLQNE